MSLSTQMTPHINPKRPDLSFPLSGQTKLQVFQLLLSDPIKILGYQNHAQGKQDLINPNGSDSLSVRGGLGAARVRAIFNQARCRADISTRERKLLMALNLRFLLRLNDTHDL